MYIGSEGTVYKSEDAYLADVLRLCFTLSPYSIPVDTSVGIEVQRDSDVADLVRYQVMQILRGLSLNNVLNCTSCYLDGDTIYVEIINSKTNNVTTYSFA